MSQAEDSILQVCQLTELKQQQPTTKNKTTKQQQGVGKLPKPIPTSLQEHPCQKTWELMYSREWPAGKTDSEIKLPIQEHSKQQDFIVYSDGSVAKDQSARGFTVKQGATTIHNATTTRLNLQLDNEGGSSLPCPPLDCLKR